MRKILSVILTTLLLVLPMVETAVFAAPGAVDVTDVPFEEAFSAETEYDAELEAASDACGKDLTWTIDENGTLTISGTGDMYIWDRPNLVPWYSSRENIKLVVIGDGVTNIGEYAFRSCSSLTSVVIPDSVTSIGFSAFFSCTSLESIEIPDSVISIGDFAFYNCYSLTSVVIPDSVTSIGNSAFLSCTSLESIEIPDSVISIGDYAFNYCTSLASIEIPDSVISIGNSAFFECCSLTSVVIPDSVTSIGSNAFNCCYFLERIEIPASVTSIGERAFDHCDILKIHGHADTYAQSYANSNGIPFVVLESEEEEPDPDAKATVALSDEYARAGETISVIVFLSTDELINTIGVSGITFDSNVLTFAGFTQYDEVKEITVLDSYDENKMAVVIALKEPQTFDGRLFAINFVVNENAADGKNVIDVSSLIKFNDTEIVVNDVAGSVTVVSEALGDISRDETIDVNDAILLLQHSLFPELYPIEYKGSLDFTRDGVVDMNDAVLLLQHSLFPDLYPIQ